MTVFTSLLFIHLQKAKKSKKQKTDASEEADAECGPSTSKQPKFSEPVSKDSKLTNGTTVPKTVNGTSQKLTNGNKASKLTSQTLTNGSTVRNPLNSGLDLPTGSSIQRDPKASAAYKSLFTSCNKAKNQQKGHWVTSNPYWN